MLASSENLAEPIGERRKETRFDPENLVLQIWEHKEEMAQIRVMCRGSRWVGEKLCA
jgi:hypothetical protein